MAGKGGDRKMITAWWGTYDLSDKGSLQKQIGPLLIEVKQLKNEWCIYYEQQNELLDAIEENQPEVIDFSFDEDMFKERYVLDEFPPKVTLIPALADRPFVTRPSTPFYIPSRQSVVIYVSTPLWVKIGVGEEDFQLTEIPTIRPSDSWFGPNTIRGELCYASRTKARLSVDELPKRYHRAITPIEIINKDDSHLLLEKINLPVPYLHLYEIAGKYLWTQGVRMVRKEEDEPALLEILKGPPSQAADGAVFLSESRKETVEDNIIKIISSSLFS